MRSFLIGIALYIFGNRQSYKINFLIEQFEIPLFMKDLSSTSATSSTQCNTDLLFDPMYTFAFVNVTYTEICEVM